MSGYTPDEVLAAHRSEVDDVSICLLFAGPARHRCALPSAAEVRTVVECTVCGRRWWCPMQMESHPMSTVMVATWTPLRWWNYRLRRAVTAHEEAQP